MVNIQVHGNLKKCFIQFRVVKASMLLKVLIRKVILCLLLL